MIRKNRFVTTAVVGVAALSLAACATEAEPGDEMSATEDSMEATAEATHDAMESESSDDAMEDDSMEEDAMEDEGSDDAMAADVPEELQFTTVTLDGEEFNGESLAGVDSILWAWASWCPTCQAEAPKVVAANEQLPEGVTLYGLPGQADIESSQYFVDTYGVGSFDQIYDEDGSLWANFGIAYQPAFVLINDDGTFETIGGSLDTDGILEAAEELASK
ncbi:redoxin family protein [Demequina flava]|uniref:redoxin family protein n=1 Tax=Demequina flava TaxID=1095025 RepID=UPI0007805CE1|nr:redoxin family protein [Demequina flava]